MVEKKIEEKKEVKQERYEVSQVPETMREVIIDNKTGTALTEINILVEILNKIDKIERGVA